MSPSADRPQPSRVRRRDVLAVGSMGLRTRRLRAALSAVGIAIGIASMVAVLGLSASSQADLLDTIDRLGTNLLTVEPGQTFGGEAAELPPSAPTKIAALAGVRAGSAIYALDEARIYRNALVPEQSTSGITVYAADRSLPATLGAEVVSGRGLDAATERLPTVVLGSVAARRLGLSDLSGEPLATIDGRSYRVVGILGPVTLDPSLDRAALVGLPHAREDLDADAVPVKVYARTDPDALADVRDVAAATASPENPEEVDVSRPSDALEARAAAEGAFTSLFLGLGAVALLVGGVGIANVMVISVLERRSEIGLRRALGATRRHVAAQFVTESLMLAVAGGVAGAVLGAGATAAYGLAQGQDVVVPPVALAGGVAAAVVIGAVAGLYPARRAARLSPTEALRAA